MVHTRRPGFTLIELLVVIVIIAILAAILFPVFVRARERGKQATCKSNLKQIAIGLQQYLDDWNGCFPDQACKPFPPGYVDTANVLQYFRYFGMSGGNPVYSNEMGGAWIHWFQHRYRYKMPDGRYVPAGIALPLKPYFKSLGVFKCPSEIKTRPYDANYATDSFPVLSSYFVKLGMCVYASAKARPLRMADIRYPLRASFIYEEAWHSGGKSPFLYQPGWAGLPRSEIPPTVKVNTIYFDCHVASSTLPYLYNYNQYGWHWYFYDKNDQFIGEANGLTRGWDLSDGVHDRQ